MGARRRSRTGSAGRCATETRDERIALAVRTIAGVLGPDDQLDPEHGREFEEAAIVTVCVMAGAL